MLPGILWGAFTQPQDAPTQQAFEQLIGRRMSLAHQSTAWADIIGADGKPRYGNLTGWMADAISRHWVAGQMTIMTWGSWLLSNQTDPRFNMPSIISGAHDAFIHSFAKQCAALQIPFYIRFDWEMNGWWFLPWSETDKAGNPVLGNNKGDYVKMWRHVVDIFRQEGANNVMWLWCVNASANPTSSDPTNVDHIIDFYPGDDYCYGVALDSYNKNTPWLTFDQTMHGGAGGIGDTYGTLLKIAPNKPVFICEFGCHDVGGDKNAWLKDAFIKIPRDYPQIRGVSYFNWASEGTTKGNWTLTATNAKTIKAAMDLTPQWLDGECFELPQLSRPAPLFVTGGPDPTNVIVAPYQSQIFDLQQQILRLTQNNADVTGLYNKLQAQYAQGQTDYATLLTTYNELKNKATTANQAWNAFQTSMGQLALL